jgi:hypothetical protein
MRAREGFYEIENHYAGFRSSNPVFAIQQFTAETFELNGRAKETLIFSRE